MGDRTIRVVLDFNPGLVWEELLEVVDQVVRDNLYVVGFDVSTRNQRRCRPLADDIVAEISLPRDFATDWARSNGFSAPRSSNAWRSALCEAVQQRAQEAVSELSTGLTVAVTIAEVA